MSVLPAINSILSKIRLGRINDATTMNFGTINIGTSANSIPGIATIKGDIRSDQIEHIQDLITAIKGNLDGLIELGYRVKLITSEVVSGYKLYDSSSFLHTCKTCVTELIGKAPQTIKTQSGTDLAILTQKGIEGVLVASGAMRCHTNEEYIGAEDLNGIAKLIIDILQAV